MKIFVKSLMFVAIALQLLSCGKESGTESRNGNRKDLYRDWTQKGERTVNPELQKMFDGQQKQNQK